MNRGQPSKTAEWVARHRAVHQVRENSQLVLHDPLAGASSPRASGNTSSSGRVWAPSPTAIPSPEWKRERLSSASIPIPGHLTFAPNARYFAHRTDGLALNHWIEHLVSAWRSVG